MSFREDHPEVFWVLIFLIGFFLLWIAAGGPEKSISIRNDKFIEPIAPIGAGKTYDEPLIERDSSGRIINPILQ